MAKKAYLDASYQDAAKRVAVVSYQLVTDLDDDGGNIADVMTNADDLETALNVLSMDKIIKTEIRFEQGGGGADADVAANNQVHARTYFLDSGSNVASFDLPAWDDPVFSQDSFNLLSPAYNTAAAAVALLIKNPVTNLASAALGGVQRSISRTHKSRGKKVV